MEDLKQYTPDFQRFLKEHTEKINNLTRNEHDLLQFLVERKICDFEKIVKLYRELTK